MELIVIALLIVNGGALLALFASLALLHRKVARLKGGKVIG